MDNRRYNRVPRRRGLSSAEIRTADVSPIEVEPEIITRLQPIDDAVEITGCTHRPEICGKEAACRSFDDSTSKCVCPHDLSAPTSDLKCPNRSIVPLTPRPIHNIIPPSGNATTNGTSITNGTTIFPEAEQIERIRPRVPEIIGVSVAFFVVLIIILVITYCIRKRNYGVKSQRNSLDRTPMNLQRSLLLANKYTPNPHYLTSSTSPGVPILRRENLAILEVIGQGAFGKVHRGKLQTENSEDTVAIKILNDFASREDEEDFTREVDIMSTFHHQNILSLRGVVLREDDKSPCMVFEYMPYGDLAGVLRANNNQLKSPTANHGGAPRLTQDSLLWISIQIAAGMAYLSSQRFVHRDLACRNCLVGLGLVVKIADFGMSRDVYTCDYYKTGGFRKLPIRWMSPESLMYGRFTLESDIWSFGVVLWEIYSYGAQPYFGHTNEGVRLLLLQGVLLNPPTDCPSYISQVMSECWKRDPKDRIKFPDILERLEKIQNKPIVQQASLPRPPQGPVTVRTPNVLDPDGYLLPSPTIHREYFKPLPT